MHQLFLTKYQLIQCSEGILFQKGCVPVKMKRLVKDLHAWTPFSTTEVSQGSLVTMEEGYKGKLLLFWQFLVQANEHLVGPIFTHCWPKSSSDSGYAMSVYHWPYMSNLEILSPNNEEESPAMPLAANVCRSCNDCQHQY